MTNTSTVTEIFNGLLESVNTVLPFGLTRQAPRWMDGPVLQNEIGVLVGFTGDTPGRMAITGSTDTFGKIATSLYGMTLEGAMLESFIGEIGNQIGGNLCTQVSNNGLTLDITPPTVLVGQTKLSGFNRALLVPIVLNGHGELEIILILEQLA